MKNSMIKVKWLKAHWDYAYSQGDIGYVSADKAAKLLNGGFVMPLPDDEEAEKVNPLPVDLPGRGPLFAVGYETLEALKQAGDSLLDAGISITTLKKITTYLKDMSMPK